jgi:hypothetical protein
MATPVGWVAGEWITHRWRRESGKCVPASLRRQPWHIRLTRPPGALNSPGCLVDRVVLERVASDRVAARIIWRGGEDTMLAVDMSARALRDLSGIGAMEARVAELARTTLPDAEIAGVLTREGFRSPLRDRVLTSTVSKLRLRAGILRWPEGRARRHVVPGWLTVPQLAERLEVDVAWIHHRIRNGTIAVPRDRATRMYLFLDAIETVTAFQALKAGNLRHLDFGSPARS